MRPQPLICLTDVERSSHWYEALLACESGHGGDEYERLTRDGTLVLQLHRFDVEHHHGRIGDPAARPYGNGLALWFEIDDFDDAVTRSQALEAEVARPPHRNSPRKARW
jgi:catechol 2,3-dioxygenase-like lactoylglutathione lyase family enzyme